MIRHLDNFCYGEFKNKNKLLCGAYNKNWHSTWNVYDFKGIDFLEVAFLASKKNNPFMDKWYYIIKKYWDHRVKG